jgi:quercetin dioxygenase-like cupin family protein
MNIHRDVNEHGVMGIVLNTDLSLTLKLNAFVLAGEGDAETLSMPRDFPLIRFNEIPWTSVAQGAREKRVVCGNYTLRLVEFAPPFIEVDWCHKQHLGFVVSGVFRVQFVDTLVSFKEGDGIAIVAGEATKHRAVVDQTVTLFLVEPTT